MKTAVFSFVAFTCSCANAFTVSPSSRSIRSQASTRTTASSSSSLRMGLLKEADFVPSEEWLGEYMGQQGLRYALNKTPEEVDTEGDYTLLEKLFGQTSNNKARMTLKQQVLDEADIPTNPERYKAWTAKYGYGRFFPVYVDKSGSPDGAPAPVAKAAPAKAAAKPMKQAAAKPVAAKAAPKAGAPKAAAKRSSPVKAAAPKVVAAKPAAAKPVAKPKPAPKKVVAAAPKPAGNIKNLPKAL